MKCKIYLLELAFLLGTTMSFSQMLTPSVIAPAGGFFANNTGMLSATVGEMAMVHTFANDNSILTQGFQQTWTGTLSVPESEVLSDIFTLYPNPTDNEIYLRMEAKQPGSYALLLYNTLGQIIRSDKFELQEGQTTKTFDISFLAQGAYWFRLEKTDTKTIVILRFNKIN